MSTQSAENYLDELLNSVSTGKKQDNLMEEDIFEPVSVDKAETESVITRNTAKAEAEFLMEFEQELAGEDFDDFLKAFEENDIQPEDRLEEADMSLTEEDALLSMLGGNFSDDLEPMEPVMEESSGREEISLEELALEGIEIEEAFAEVPLAEEPDLSSDYNVGPTEAIDLSQMGEEDLISLLAGTEDLADIGQLFAQNDSNIPMDGEDPFATFAEQEMTEHEEEIDIIKQEKKPAKKGGFWAKLSALLFGKEEEEQVAKAEPISLTPDEMPGVVELSEENADILSLFAEADVSSVDESSTAGKGKGKKEKKEKKKKEPKPKAPKKPKEPKPKKEKKPKEKDNTPPLPKGPVALVCLLAISIFVLVFFGTDLISYSSAMSKAEELYKLGQYAEAAEALAGVTVKDEDALVYGQIATLATVDSQLSEYEIFMKNDRKAEALDSLISAAGRCVLNEENSYYFDCAGEMGVLKDRVTVELQEEFGMSYKEATELYALTEYDRAEYTRELNKIYEKLGLITE